MYRSAFSLIELIFVILIGGILASVVMVKFVQMREQAEQTRLLAFVGTLNRTTGQSLWMEHLDAAVPGSIKGVDWADFQHHTQIPEGYGGTFDLSQCNAAGDGKIATYPAASVGTNFEIHCQDGTQAESPKFRLYNADDHLYVH